MRKLVVIGRFYARENLYGSEKFIKRFYEHVKPRNTELIFIDFYFGYSPKNLFRKFFGKHILDSGHKKEFWRMGILPLIFTVAGADVIGVFVSNLEGYGLIASIITKIFNGKLSYLVNGIYRFELPEDKKGRENIYFKYKNKLLEWWFLTNTDLIIQLSRQMDLMINKYYPGLSSDTVYLTHGIDDVFFNFKENFNKESRLSLIYAGGFGRGLKGFDYLLNSLNLLDFDIELIITGSVNDRVLYQNRIQKLSNKVHIKNVGFCTADELAAHFRNSDIAVVPSKFESFSITALEAMASSLTLIVTKSSGIAELLKHEENAILVEYGNNEMMAEVITNLNYNRRKLENIGKTAYKFAESFRWSEVAENYYKILTDDEK